jgi:hypothetical protein
MSCAHNIKLKRTACHVTPFAFAKARATPVCREYWPPDVSCGDGAVADAVERAILW